MSITLTGIEIIIFWSMTLLTIFIGATIVIIVLRTIKKMTKEDK